LTRRKELDAINSKKLKQPNDLESIKSLLDQVNDFNKLFIYKKKKLLLFLKTYVLKIIIIFEKFEH
jgi:hypothetical protein